MNTLMNTVPANEPEKLSVLLVEDDELLRSSAAAILRDLGYRVLETPSAEEAMATLQVAPVDVLVTDLGLPGVSGEVFAAEARSLCPDLRIVFATGSDRIANLGGGGASPVLLRKPYDSNSLSRALLATGPERSPDLNPSPSVRLYATGLPSGLPQQEAG